MSAPPPARPAGFTLIELLVVVAIIVALLAILLPSMNKAIGVAEDAACRSNLRQLSLAFLSFASDHFTVLPGNINSPGAEPWQHNWVGGGTNNDPAYVYATGPHTGTIYPYAGQRPELYRCPSVPFVGVNTQVGSNGKWDYGAWMNFAGAKISLMPSTSEYRAPGGTRHLATPILSEGDPAFYMNNYWTDGAHGAGDRIGTPHYGGASNAALDGSVYHIVPEPATNCGHWWGRAPSGNIVDYGSGSVPFGTWNTR